MESAAVCCCLEIGLRETACDFTDEAPPLQKVAAIPSLRSKIVVVGASGAGKTSFLQSLLGVPFDAETPTTIGVDFVSWPCEVDGQRSKLQIWDTAGQEHFKSVARSSIRGSAGAVLVFDVIARASLDAMAEWIRDVANFCLPNAVFLAATNKADLADQREVSKSDFEAFADRNRLDVVETWAVTRQNVTELFLRWPMRDGRGRGAEPSKCPEPYPSCPS
jgi:Ras-related protein Rab-2A